jgi:hypothetical protein
MTPIPFAPSADRDRVRTAYHEAGHALVGYVLGRRVERVVLDPGGSYADIHPAAGGPDPERDALVAMGGIAAELVKYGRLRGKATGGGNAKAGSDLERLAGGPYGPADLRPLWSEARRLLAQPGHREPLDLIAAELLRKGSLDGADVVRLYARGVRQAGGTLLADGTTVWPVQRYSRAADEVPVEETPAGERAWDRWVKLARDNGVCQSRLYSRACELVGGNPELAPESAGFGRALYERLNERDGLAGCNE